MIKSKFLPGQPEPDNLEMNNFFGAYLIQGANTNYLIDTGVGSGINNLIKNIRKENINKLDYILLSHIHLDHGGGLFEIMEAFPEAKIIVHENGLRHLINPKRLWESTKEVMGDLAPMYGEPFGVNPERLISHKDVNLEEFKIYEVPGHAQHSLAFDFKDFVFVGEAGGCPIKKNGQIYQRPATPPKYIPELTLNSVNLLLSLEDRPAYFGHAAQTLPLHETLNIYLKQLSFWGAHIEKDLKTNTNVNETLNEKIIRITDNLTKTDENLIALHSDLNEIGLKREKYFLRNSAEGFIRFFTS